MFSQADILERLTRNIDQEKSSDVEIWMKENESILTLSRTTLGNLLLVTWQTVQATDKYFTASTSHGSSTLFVRKRCAISLGKAKNMYIKISSIPHSWKPLFGRGSGVQHAEFLDCYY